MSQRSNCSSLRVALNFRNVLLNLDIEYGLGDNCANFAVIVNVVTAVATLACTCTC